MVGHQIEQGQDGTLTVIDDETEDGRSKPPWSAGKKLDAVLRLLRGEKLDALSRGWSWGS